MIFTPLIVFEMPDVISGGDNTNAKISSCKIPYSWNVTSKCGHFTKEPGWCSVEGAPTTRLVAGPLQLP